MAKRLVVCCDGTWDTAEQPYKTNVTKVAESVRPGLADGKDQRVYYGSGVGTRRFERYRGGAFGEGLSENVMDAYRFLVGTYEPGDELFFFGFSRGAFTARSLAGLVRNSGILRQGEAGRIKEAWTLYRDRNEQPGGAAATAFRRSYAHETEIHFIGVWDTVGALGIPPLGPRWTKPLANLFDRRYAFHDTQLSSWVKGAFQALAIDETRSPFEPTLWHQQPGAAQQGQELKQNWFSGVHTDIGGGYKESGLSDITLMWIVDQARRYGLEFDDEVLGVADPSGTKPGKNIDFHVLPDALSTLHDSRKGMYRLTKPVHRPIGRAADDKGRPDGDEFVASTAKERYDKAADYRPPELERYLADTGRVRLDQVA